MTFTNAIHRALREPFKASLKQLGRTTGDEMNDIQETIEQYLATGAINNFTRRCFIGMLETGEATWDDFKTVGGTALCADIAKGFTDTTVAAGFFTPTKETR